MDKAFFTGFFDKSVFEEAAALVERRGHAKGVLEAWDGRICAYQALTLASGMRDASHGTEYQTRTRDRAVRYFELTNAVNICTWNNSSYVTQKDVVAAFRKLAPSRKPAFVPNFAPLETEPV